MPQYNRRRPGPWAVLQVLSMMIGGDIKPNKSKGGMLGLNRPITYPMVAVIIMIVVFVSILLI